MSSRKNPNEPISNLEIGAVIEVDGTHIVADLDPMISDLSRVYGWCDLSDWSIWFDH